MSRLKKRLDPFDIDIGWRIRTIRMRHKETMLQLGQHIGVSYNQINKYEKGIDRISNQNLHKISRHYDVPIGYFFGEEKGADVENYSSKILGISAEIENMPSDTIREQLYSLVRHINKTFETSNST